MQRMHAHPMYVIGSGRRFVDEFIVDNRSGTHWLHPHLHERTGLQACCGFARPFIT
jgi:FtsP/CotA-like multicopper oxidase with cupredoxin domain